jgi:SAM-dependent methyltransferase
MLNYWNLNTLKARIASRTGRSRFEAASPDEPEVQQYRRYLLDATGATERSRRQVVVLGMTPELRRMAAAVGCRLVSVDSNHDAIRLFRDWMPDDKQGNEEIICCDWSDLPEHLHSDIAAVLGDGVFGNVLTVAGHTALLQALGRVLRRDGVLIVRQAMIPEAFCMEEHEASHLLESFRAAKISAPDFGMGMRLWGSFGRAYNARTQLLDNGIVFARYRDWLERGKLTVYEYDILMRYYYGGKNMLLPQRDWEALLTGAGFSHVCKPLSGRKWYEYYPIYACRRKM